MKPVFLFPTERIWESIDLSAENNRRFPFFMTLVVSLRNFISSLLLKIQLHLKFQELELCMLATH
jgi:hypothetical protein